MVCYIKERIIMKLEIKNLSKSYGNIQALCNVNIELTNGIYGLLGPNGAGKSTLINLLTDNVKRESGEIYWNGTEILKLGKEYRNILGYMPQEQGYYEDFTAGTFLSYMAKVKGIKGKAVDDRIDKLLNMVNLQSNRSDKIGGFSGGMRQRLMLAQALLNEPKILILDEPTAGVDPQERIRIRNYISEMAQERIIILATHIISDVEAIAKEIILIKKGQIIEKGNPNDLLKNMEANVYEVCIREEELNELKHKYIISNLKNSAEGIVARIVGNDLPVQIAYKESAATLEDLYLYHFNK